MHIDRLFKADIRILQKIRQTGEFRFRTHRPTTWDLREWDNNRSALDRLLILELIATADFDGAYTLYGTT